MPPGFIASGSHFSAASSSSASPLTQMRSAWNTCAYRLGWAGPPSARSMASRSARVVLSPPCRASANRARARDRAPATSPCSRSTVPSSCSPTPSSRSAPVLPRDGSILRSSGPSCMKLIPLAESSICLDDRPRSNRAPTNPPPPAAVSATGTSRNVAWARRTRVPNFISLPAAYSSADGSQSQPSSRAPGSASSSASACPASPSVASR
jgi:hypothetical protein